MQKPHLPTVIWVALGVLALFVVYHLAFGKK